MSKSVKKTVFILFLLLVAFSFTLYSFNNLNDDKYVSAMQLNLDENQEIKVEKVLTNDVNKRLVPKGAILGIDEVDQVVVSYDISLNNSKELVLDVKAQNILIGNDVLYNHLINIEIIKHFEQNNYKVEAIITLNIPANETEYRAIINQKITFTLVFSAHE